ncbi:MAG: beta-ketoacyl-[acyl-carrier-protein] synthase family protein [Lentisphaeria bacterium]|nr:beta-ketoacyl-[acyl-carrier-protein] synthase family protein [Lentisphaeria bacterium]
MEMKITGMGLVCSLGGGVADVFKRMCAGECGFRPITRFEAEPFAQKNAGQLPEELENDLRETYPDDDLSTAMMKRAGSEAMAQSTAVVPPERQGILLATNFGPMETLEWAWRERLDTQALDEASYAPYDGVIAQIAEAFGCKGPRLQISMSCASGAAAASLAADVIREGRADRMLVLAYDSLTEYTWCGLSNLRTITTDVMRPFDPKRSGTIFSEGAAAMVLERPDAATTALAWVSGSATNNNAFHMTAPPKDAAGSQRVMEDALANAGLTTADLTHVCAHATSTHANDETEAGALRKMFGERLPQISVAAHKSQLGHLLGAAGLAEAIITVQAMREGIIPPTINHDENDPACEPIDCIPGKARVKSFDAAITNSAGIGGNNSSLVLTRHGSGKSKNSNILDCLYMRSLAWVLPANIGKGSELLSHPEWLEWSDGINEMLATFSPKPFVKSVKGYLDPGGGYQLAAMAMAVGDNATNSLSEQKGICTATRYGATSSAFKFFEQLVQKGPRLASPLIFPHGYSNTAGNLAAIEFGYGGPHTVLFGNQDARELLEFAAARLADGTAEEILVGAYEAACMAALPDGRQVLNGAIAMKLSATPSDDDVMTIRLTDLRKLPTAMPTFGMVAALGRLLKGI